MASILVDHLLRISRVKGFLTAYIANALVTLSPDLEPEGRLNQVVMLTLGYYGDP